MSDNDTQAQPESAPPRAPRIALFVTCLVDLFRPSVGFAALELLERAGCEVAVPTSQTCCGQPSYNTGDYEATVPVAKAVVTAFEDYDYTVVPSGSCAGMLVHHYPRLLEGDWRVRAEALAAKTFELTQFLHDVLGAEPDPASPACARVTYHDSCAGLRELGIRTQPRELLTAAGVADIRELPGRDACCGFGGTFCAKMPEISARMADEKLGQASATGAGIVTGGDMGCLLSLAGRARRTGSDLRFFHVAELLRGGPLPAGIAESAQAAADAADQ